MEPAETLMHSQFKKTWNSKIDNKLFWTMEERTVQRIGLDSVVYYVHTLKQQKNVAGIQDGQDNNTHDAKDY